MAWCGRVLAFVCLLLALPVARAQVIDTALKAGSAYGPFNVGVTGIAASFQPGEPYHKLVVGEIITGTPAAGQFQVNDVIVSVNGEAITGDRPRIVLGTVLTEAEASDGMLDFAIERGGTPMNVQISIPVLGPYSPTWPIDCPKSEAIVQSAADYYAGAGISGANPVDRAFQVLFLLSTGDDQYLDEVAAYVTAIGVPGEGPQSNWALGYNGIALAEYYLRTGDASVLGPLQAICDKLLDQNVGGGWGHAGSALSIGYAQGGLLNAAGAPALAALVLARECGVLVDEAEFEKCFNFFWRFAGRGGVSYGVYQPDVGILNGNSKNATMACLLSLLGSADARFESAAQTMAMQVLHAYPAWDSGHTGNGLRVGWEALAIALLPASKDALFRQHNDSMAWFFDLCRHPLGGFQKIPGNGSDQYLTRSWGAVAGFIYTAPRKHLRLCGGAPTPHSVAVAAPAITWGNAADDEMFGIDPLPEYGVDDLTIEDLRLAQKNVDSQTVAYFERLLSHATQIFRYIGAKGLAEKFNAGDGTALTPLLAALQHDELRVRRAAMHGFSKHGIDPSVVGTQALPLVVAVLGDPNSAGWELHGVLGMLAASEPSAVATHRARLYELSTLTDTWMREEVANAIGALGSEAVVADVEILARMYAVEPWVNTRGTIAKQCAALVDTLVQSGLTATDEKRLVQLIGRNFVNDPYLSEWAEERHLYSAAETLLMLEGFNDNAIMSFLYDEVSYWLHQWTTPLANTGPWSQAFEGTGGGSPRRGLADYADGLGAAGAWIVHGFKEISDKTNYALVVDGDDEMEPMADLITGIISTYENDHGPVPYPWNAPVANAGPDRALPPSALLDGSGSSDPDGGIVSWVWELDGELVARGEQVPLYVLPLGLQTIQLRVTDNYGLQSTDTMTVNVSGILNTPPVGDTQSVVVLEGGSVDLVLTGSDTEGSPLSYSVADNPAHGNLAGIAPNITYTADTGYHGTDSFTFTCNDGIEDGPPATVNVTILSDTGHPPGLWYALQRYNDQGPNPNTRVSLDLSEIEAGWANHVEVFSGYFYDADGHVSFTEHMHGSDQRIYIDDVLVLSDNQWNVRTGTQDLALIPGWHRIEIRVTNHGGVEGSPGIGYDPEGGTDWIALADPGDGSLLRHAAADAGSNVAPVASGASHVTGGSQISFTVPGSDPNLDAFRHTIPTAPTNGTLYGAKNNGYDPARRYLPNPGFVGIETLQYVLNDEQAVSNTAAIKISVVHELPPEVYGQSFVAAEAISNWITLEGSDANGQNLTFEILDAPDHGTLSGTAPNLLYQPESGFSGPDSFTFRAFDGIAYSAARTVNIVVVQDSDWVTLANDDFEGPEWGSYTGTNGAALESNFNKAHSGEYSVRLHPKIEAAMELTNGIDVASYDVIKVDFWINSQATSVGSGFDVEFYDGTTWRTVGSYRNVHTSTTVTEFDYSDNNPAHKTLFIEAKDVPFPADMKIAFRSVSFGAAGSGIHQVYLDDILVQAAVSGGSDNLRPIAHSQALVVSPGANPIVLAATDPDGDPVTYNYTDPDHGALSGTAPDLTYTPEAGYSGPDTFTFWANDGMGDGSIATVGLLVDQDVVSNNPPSGTDQNVAVDEGLSQAITLAGLDADGDSLTFAVSTPPTKGTLSGVAPNLIYTSSPGQTGQDSFSFVPNDGKVAGTAGTVTIDIEPDTLAPLPNPSRWYVEPFELGPGSVSMTAQTGFEVSGLEFYFTCVTGNGHDSGWQDSPTYVDSGLARGQTYGYTVKARDKSAARNETAPSGQRDATLGGGINSVLGQGLLAYWSFDETVGTGLADQSAWGHDGVAHTNNTETLPEWVSGKLDGGVDLYPDASYSIGNGFLVNSGGPDLPEEFTIAFWIQPNNADTESTVLAQRGETAQMTYRVKLREGGTRVYMEAGDNTDFWGQGMVNGAWNHVVLTWDCETGIRRIYINRKLAGQDANAAPIPPADPLGTQRVLMLGYFAQSLGGSAAGQNFLSASLDDMAIWDRALSTDEIEWLYDNGAGRSVSSSDEGETTVLANFMATPRTGLWPLNVSFSDASTGAPISWAWDFDDDGVVDSTESNPSHTYSAVGRYIVKLTVNNGVDQDDESKTDIIFVSEYPLATVYEPFDAYNPGDLLDQAVTGHGLRGNWMQPEAVTDWAWEFDGSSSLTFGNLYVEGGRAISPYSTSGNDTELQAEFESIPLGTWYGSFLFQKIDMSNSAEDHRTALRLYYNKWKFSGNELNSTVPKLFVDDAVATGPASSVTVGETFLIVFKSVSFNSGSGVSGSGRMWLIPQSAAGDLEAAAADGLTEAELTALATWDSGLQTDTSMDTVFTQIRLQRGGNGGVYFDELRMDPVLDRVVPFPSLPTFAQWIEGFGLAGGDKGFNGSGDSDSFDNGIEAFLGTDPSQADAAFKVVSTDGLTTLFQHPAGDFRAGDVTGTYQWSLDMANWYKGDGVDGPAGGPTVSIGASVGEGVATVTATASEALDRIFVRIAAAQ